MWEWFQQLSDRRSGNGFGPNPLSWAELLHWQAWSGERPAHWQKKLLLELDLRFLKARAEAAKESANAASAQRKA